LKPLEMINMTNKEKCYFCDEHASRYMVDPVTAKEVSICEGCYRFYCYFCGDLTDAYVVDVVTSKKVSLCEDCFNSYRPSKKNMEHFGFWAEIFPIIERA